MTAILAQANVATAGAVIGDLVGAIMVGIIMVIITNS